MGLKLKSLSEILGDMATWISTNSKKVTDFNVGSAVRTLLEAVALQMEEFYYKMHENVMWAIENSIFHAFGFDMKSANAATGYVSMFFNHPISETYTIRAGTKFSTAAGTAKPIMFSVTNDTAVPVGASEVMLSVQCDEVGEIGNVPANSINCMIAPFSLLKGITNTAHFVDGSNAETKAERKQRFLRYIQTLARGTSDAISYGCLEVDGVKGVWIDDTKTGLVNVYAHDLNGELSDELRQAIIRNLENYRAAGIEVDVLAVIKKSIDMNILIIVHDDADAQMYASILEDTVTKYLDSFQVAKNLYLSELIRYTKNLYDDVIVSMKLEQQDDIFANQRELIRAGKINVTIIHSKTWGE